MIEKLKVDGIQIKKLGLVTFEGGGGHCFRGSRYFRGVATFGIYLRPQKIDVNFGGGGATFGASLLSELYGNILDFYIQKIENFRSLET